MCVPLCVWQVDGHWALSAYMKTVNRGIGRVHAYNGKDISLVGKLIRKIGVGCPIVHRSYLVHGIPDPKFIL